MKKGRAFVILGWIMAVLGVFMLLFTLYLFLLCPKTSAVQTEWGYYRGGKRIVYTYMYEVEDKTYTFTVNKPSSSKAPKDPMTVHYVKAMPQVHSDTTLIPFGIMLSVFGPLLIIGAKGPKRV